jgi:hypothetical protein
VVTNYILDQKLVSGKYHKGKPSHKPIRVLGKAQILSMDHHNNVIDSRWELVVFLIYDNKYLIEKISENSNGQNQTGGFDSFTSELDRA